MALFKVQKKSAFGDDTKYSRAIQIPQYEPKNQKPFLDSLFDKRKYARLMRNIDKAVLSGDITEEEAYFLRLSASRHIVFHYDLIADYYANSNEAMQNLMEESALVIVDIEDAILNGYVETTDRIREIISGARKTNESKT